MRYKYTEADKSRFIKKNTNLTDEQKEYILNFLAESSNTENFIKDWNYNITFDTFQKAIYNYDNNFSKLPSWTLDDLEEGNDYTYLGEYGNYKLYFPYTHKASVTLASNNVFPEIWSALPSWYNEDNRRDDYIYDRRNNLYSGAKWCISMNHDSEEYSYFRNYIEGVNDVYCKCFVIAISKKDCCKKANSDSYDYNKGYLNKYAIILNLDATFDDLCDGVDCYAKSTRMGDYFSSVVAYPEFHEEVIKCISHLCEDYNYKTDYQKDITEDDYENELRAYTERRLYICGMSIDSPSGITSYMNQYKAFEKVVGKDLIYLAKALCTGGSNNERLEHSEDFIDSYTSTCMWSGRPVNGWNKEECVRYLFGKEDTSEFGVIPTSTSLIEDAVTDYGNDQFSVNLPAFEILENFNSIYFEQNERDYPVKGATPSEITKMLFTNIDTLNKNISDCANNIKEVRALRKEKLTSGNGDFEDALAIKTVEDAIHLFHNVNEPLANDPYTSFYNTLPIFLLNYIKIDSQSIPLLYFGFVFNKLTFSYCARGLPEYLTTKFLITNYDGSFTFYRPSIDNLLDVNYMDTHR